MQELVKISKQKVGNEEVNAVNARDLWRVLEIKKDFSNWIKQQIDSLGLIEGIDYIVLTLKGEQKEGSGGHNRIDYILTLDTAKHIAMASRTEKGKEVRLYFIQAEKELRQFVLSKPDSYMIDDPVERASRWIEEEQKRIELEAKNKELAPKADAYDVISNSRRLSTVSQVSALFDLGRNRLYKMLKEAKFVMENNKPYQKWIDSGHFDYKIDKVNGKQYFVTLITGKGIQLLQKEFNINQDEEEI